MTTDYQLTVLYGYRILIPHDADPLSYRRDLYSLGAALPEPFRIVNLLSHIPMCGDCTSEEYERLDALTTLWVGFIPSTPEAVLQQSVELRDFLTENILFDGVEFEKEPQFHCGVEWLDDEDQEEEEEDQEEEEDEEEEEEDQEEEEEEEDETETEEEADEEDSDEEDDEEDKN